MEAWRSTRSPAWKVRSRKPEDKYDCIVFGVKGIPAFLFSLQANLKTFNKDQNVLWNRCSTNKDDTWRKNVHTVLHLDPSPENSGKQTPPMPRASPGAPQSLLKQKCWSSRSPLSVAA